MKREIKLSLPLINACIISARLTAGVVCNQLNLGIDDSEDVKLCVTEACNILANQNFCMATITYDFDKDLQVTFAGEECEEGCRQKPADNELSLLLLNGLCDEVRYDRSGEVINRITLCVRTKS